MTTHSRLLSFAGAALLGAILVTACARTAVPTGGVQAVELTRGGQPAELSVTAAGEHSVRITLKVLGAALPPSPSLSDREWPKPAISLRTIAMPVKATVGALRVTVSPSPLTVKVSDAAGRTVQELVFDTTGTVTFKVGDAPVLGMGEGGQQPGGRGGRGDPGPQFDRRGKLDVMRPGWGSGTLGSRNPVALLVGTDGWGLFVASPWVQVDLRDPKTGKFLPTNNATPTAGVDNPAPRAGGAGRRGGRGNAATTGTQTAARAAMPTPRPTPPPATAAPFDVFVFDAHQPADMMKDLRDLCGAPAMPPLWAMGYMQSHRELRDAKLDPQDLMLNVVDTFREKKIPLDAVIYLGTGFTPTGWNKPQPSFEFNPAVFKDDPKSVIKKIHDANVKVIVHMRDLSARDMPNIQGNIPPKPGEPLDNTHIWPYWQQHQPLIDAGIDAFWPDEGDRFSIFERMTREKMYYQGGLASQPNVRPWSINRNGVIGMAQWGAWMWSGDTQSQWNTLRDQIWIGQNVGLSITPYWGSDTGGFYTTAELTGELYTRWFQFSAFCGSFRSHGRIWRLRLPWGWGLSEMGFLEGQNAYPGPEEMNNPKIEPITKKYDELRYQLLPYNYTLTREAYDTGLPLMRALWLHYPTDPQALGQSQEFLWGRDMLVAPVFEKGATAREVYLPKGTWYDWWTNEKQQGGKSITRPVDLATMPIYTRAGAIIPFDPVRQYAAEKVSGPTTLKVYRGADGTFTMYEDDGISQDYQKNKGTWTKMTWNDGSKKLTLEPGTPPGAPALAPAPRSFKVELLPDGGTKTVDYTGKRIEVTF